MTDLTERLIALRDAPAPGLDGREDYFLDHHTRELLAEAANRIEELELAEMKNAGRPSQVIGRSGTSGSLIRTSASARHQDCEQEGEGT